MKNIKKRGFFIVFEGCEGAGKSVQTRLLADALTERGFDVVVTREPGGTRIGEQIRAITHNLDNVDLHPVAEAYLMAAARAQHVAETIEPALRAGKIVICDRFVDSSVAYQGYGRKLGSTTIATLNKLAVDGAVADVVILLDVPPKVGLSRRRASAKADDRLDRQENDFYARVYEGYKTIANQSPNRYVVIDASFPIPDVAARVRDAVEPYLGKDDAKG